MSLSRSYCAVLQVHWVMWCYTFLCCFWVSLVCVLTFHLSTLSPRWWRRQKLRHCVAVEIRSAQTLLPDFSSKNLKAHLEVLILHGPGVGLLWVNAYISVSCTCLKLFFFPPSKRIRKEESWCALVSNNAGSLLYTAACILKLAHFL